MSTDIATSVFVGRLTRDCEMSHSKKGTAVARFSIANNQNRKQGDEWISEVHYFDMVMFGNRAESLSQYLTKGKAVAIRATPKQQRWEDEETESMRSRVVFYVDDLQLLGGKTSDTPKRKAQSKKRKKPQPDLDDDFDDDIPF